jgi:imidazoleglycerol phosphate dehydratase HisB
MLGHADRVRTKVKTTTKEAVELERRSDGPNGFRISVYISLSRNAKIVGASKTGLAVVDSVTGQMSGFVVDIGIHNPNADKAELVKNAGFALGEGLRKLIDKRKAKDSASFIQASGKAMCMFAINAKRQPGEANLQIIGTPERGFDPDHFFSFFDGLAQGMEAEVNAVVNFGDKNNGQADFISKTFAGSLKQIFQER